METTLRSFGKVKGIVVPDLLLEELGFEIGDKLDATVNEGKLVVVRIANRQNYKLANLLAKCDPSALMPQELVDWDSARGVGIED